MFENLECKLNLFVEAAILIKGNAEVKHFLQFVQTFPSFLRTTMNVADVLVDVDHRFKLQVNLCV